MIRAKIAHSSYLGDFTPLILYTGALLYETFFMYLMSYCAKKAKISHFGGLFKAKSYI